MMRKDNTVNYNTKESEIKAFSDVNPAAEKEDLKKYKRNYTKNTDDRYNLPNKKKLRYNKATKTWQDLSKDEVEDKIKALENIKIKSFDEIVNENGYAFGTKELNSETYLTDLEKDIFLQKGNLNQIKESVKGNPYISTILNELDIHFTEMIELIRSRHDNFLNR